VDPVRVFEDFATVDLLSGGRAEILAGRGAFTESFPLFGYDIDKRDALFAEHLELLLLMNEHERVTWSGKLRPALEDAQIAPRPLRGRLPIWVGVGVSNASAARAAKLGLPMNLAILGTSARMKPIVDAYRAAGAEAGHPEKLRVAISSHMHIQDDGRRARDEFHGIHSRYFQSYGRPGTTRAEFDALVDPKDGLLVGSPSEIAEKILAAHELFGHDRYMGQIDIGGLPFAKVATTIELFATKVAPVVRSATKKSG
jgi:alkanesulfonate monooxygenase SsuD/methylene tetrahydromethanopterin reductase-like flavin-dependent oxidoreductase (luciferase family)